LPEGIKTIKREARVHLLLQNLQKGIAADITINHALSDGPLFAFL